MLLVTGATAQAEIRVDLPTDNDALFRNRPSDFYMYVDRNFEGQRSSPWEGGQYGYVRTPIRVGGQVIYRRFHEGIDIKPVRRNSAGEPLDDVRPVAPGRVVYVNDSATASNYGRYIVVEHVWDGCRYYSLYAHLNGTSVKEGQRVDTNTVLGPLGYTGRGINRTRAHLHLEVGMLINSNYDEYYKEHGPSSPNRHGIYNGMNIRAMDVSRLLQESRAGRLSSIPAFISKERPFYSVLVPNNGTPDIVRRYPWLSRGTDLQGAPTLEFVFNQAGLPLAVQASNRRVSQPTIGSIRRSNMPYQYLTSGRVDGSGEKPVLSSSGARFIQQLTYPR